MNDHMKPIDSVEDITPDRLRFEAEEVRNRGDRPTAATLDRCAILIERQIARINEALTDSGVSE